MTDQIRFHVPAKAPTDRRFLATPPQGPAPHGYVSWESGSRNATHDRVPRAR